MRQKLIFTLLLGLASSAWAGANDNDILVDKIWLGESVPGQKTASLQMILTSTRSAAKLVGVSSPVAETVKMQLLSPGPGKIKARVVHSLRLPRSHAVVFGSRNGAALMMVGLKKSLNAGDHVPVTLIVELPNQQRLRLNVQAEVMPLALSYQHYSGKEVHDRR